MVGNVSASSFKLQGFEFIFNEMNCTKPAQSFETNNSTLLENTILTSFIFRIIFLYCIFLLLLSSRRVGGKVKATHDSGLPPPPPSIPQWYFNREQAPFSTAG